MSPRCRFAKTARPKVSVRAEPFRVFFPIAILASLAGVLLWPLLYAGQLNFFPAEAHARLMVQGFVGGFALGFLGTAFPKMIGSAPLSVPELVYLFAALAGCIVCHAANFLAAGDWCFLLLWLGALTFLGTRLAFFRDALPPPGFVLTGLGILAGVSGTVMLLVGRIITLGDFQRALAPLLLYEGFILGPIIGVGGFLFPRFFKQVPEPFPRPLRQAWTQRAMRQFWLGMLLLGTFLFQAAGSESLAPLARAAIVAAVLLTQLPLLDRRSGTGSLSTMLRVALCLLIVGTAVASIDPAGRVAAKHTLFVGGYAMLALAVASRVTLGHSGNIALAEGKNRPLQIITGVVLLALGTRVVAGFVPAIRVSHHIYAALLWVTAVAIWTWGVLKFVRTPDPEDEP